IITKTDLLLAQAVGYELRDTTPFRELTVASEVRLSSAGSTYEAWPVSGGVADYLVEIVGAAPPAGISVDGFSGRIHGIPATGSAFPLDLRVTDQLGAVVEQTVTVQPGSILETEPERPSADGPLLSHYPNPVSGSTTFLFDMKANGNVRLELFDLQGRMVGTLVDAFHPAGPQEVAWHPGNLPAGVYLARLVTPQSVETRAVSVVR
ncbi:T9SS type A sorting domain-containing protein, partial [bacterium]|nr:T9SS type A sorting domain-containing protein [bacterium]